MLTFFDSLCMFAPAKINLFLSVEGRRDDGYHDICSVMCAVSLYDSVFLDINKKIGVSIVCDHPLVPENKSNFVYRAVGLFLEELSHCGLPSDFGVVIHIVKRIPVGSGFGGGSSNVACVLLLLNRKLGYPFTIKVLMRIGKQVGSDVPFFLFGTPSIVMGVGDRLKKISSNLPKFALLVHTGLFLSTGWVYKNLSLNRKLGLTNYKKKFTNIRSDFSNFDCKKHLFNDLESVSETSFNVISDIKSVLLSFGALGVLMSGSGSGVFGLFDDIEVLVSAKKSLEWFKCNMNWTVCMVHLLVD